MARGAGVGEALRLGRMAGTSVAGPGSALWVTDFLNAAYFRRPPDVRALDDLRLAFAVLGTRWHALGRRLGARDLPSFHRAFGRARFRPGRGFGTLSRAELLAGADRLLGGWFADADAAGLRGWGVVFPSAAARAGFVPEARMRSAALGPLSPPREPPERQRWSAYRPVPLADPALTLARLADASGWPDAASELGRFTPVRSGGLAGQTFEIEVVGNPIPRMPLLTRGYVTVTRVEHADRPEGLAAMTADLSRALARAGHGPALLGPAAAPASAEPARPHEPPEALLAIELTTHRGHFMGRACSRLIVYRCGPRAFLRAVGSWDPMPWPIGLAFRRSGRGAQRAFWGEGAPAQSMLHQLAAPTSRVAPAP